MNSRSIDVVTGHRRLPMIICLALTAVIQTGCLSTFGIRTNDRTMKIVRVDLCSGIYKTGYVADPGDTITFINHAGLDVTLELPAGTVSAQDEDPATPVIEVAVKIGRKKDVVITNDPPLTQDENKNGVITVLIKDRCRAGADIIIKPAG